MTSPAASSRPLFDDLDWPKGVGNLDILWTTDAGWVFETPLRFVGVRWTSKQLRQIVQNVDMMNGITEWRPGA